MSEHIPPPLNERSGRVVCGWHGTDICTLNEGKPGALYVKPETGSGFCGQYAGFVGARFFSESVYHGHFFPEAEFLQRREAKTLDRYWECPCISGVIAGSEWCPCAISDRVEKVQGELVALLPKGETK